jgi:hypothetical protein
MTDSRVPWWNDNCREKLKPLKKILVQFHFVHRKSAENPGVESIHSQ